MPAVTREMRPTAATRPPHPARDPVVDHALRGR